MAGERRLRAAQLAGVTSIPAIVRPAAESSRHQLEMALTENLMRTDLNPMEEAAAYARLSDAFGLTHEAIALRLSRSRSGISNAIRLLDLPAPVQEAVAESRLTASHARALLVLPLAADQEAIAALVMADGLNVRETERAVQERLTRAAAPPGSHPRLRHSRKRRPMTRRSDVASSTPSAFPSVSNAARAEAAGSSSTGPTIPTWTQSIASSAARRCKRAVRAR